jgi:hypothetical protein
MFTTISLSFYLTTFSPQYRYLLCKSWGFC